MHILPRGAAGGAQGALINGLMLWRSATVLLVAMLAALTFTQVLERSAGSPLPYLEPVAIVATGLLAFFGLERRGVVLPSLVALGALLMAFPVMLFQVGGEAQAMSWQPDVVFRFGLQAMALGALVLSAPGVPLVWHRPRRVTAPRRDEVLSGLVTFLPAQAHEDLHQRRHRRRHRYLRVD